MSKEVTKFDIKVEFQGAPDTSQMNKLSEEDVDRLLTVIPATKLAQGKEVLLKMDERDKATEEYKRLLAIKRIFASTNKEQLGLGSDKDREMWAAKEPDVVQAKEQELTAILNVKLEEYKYQYLEDLFISARKQANKYEKQIDNEMQNARYGNRTNVRG